MNNVSVLFCSSRLTFKLLFTKPLRFIIQLFCSTSIEHAALYCCGSVLHLDGRGTVQLLLSDWLKMYDFNTKIHHLDIKFNASSIIIEKLIHYINGQIGVSYYTFAAIKGYLDNFMDFDNNIDSAKKNFCSQQVFDALVFSGICPKKDKLLTPIDLFNYLSTSGIFKNNWELLHVK